MIRFPHFVDNSINHTARDQTIPYWPDHTILYRTVPYTYWTRAYLSWKRWPRPTMDHPFSILSFPVQDTPGDFKDPNPVTRSRAGSAVCGPCFYVQRGSFPKSTQLDLTTAFKEHATIRRKLLDLHETFWYWQDSSDSDLDSPFTFLIFMAFGFWIPGFWLLRSRILTAAEGSISMDLNW